MIVDNTRGEILIYFIYQNRVYNSIINSASMP
jgi:hypothetical protein